MRAGGCTALGLAGTALAVLGVAAQARATPSAQNHVFVSAPAGFIGCLNVIGVNGGTACLEATSQSDGVHLSFFDGITAEEAVDPGGSITATTVSGAPAIQISASLPLAGHVQLVSVGGSQTTTGVGCELCWTPNYSIHADRSVADALTPPTPIQFGTTDDRGTIGNLQVSNGRPFYFEFNSWWVGSPVSGYYVGPAVGS